MEGGREGAEKAGDVMEKASSVSKGAICGLRLERTSTLDGFNEVEERLQRLHRGLHVKP